MVNRGRCPAHRGQRKQGYNALSASKRGYGVTHRKWRKAVLQRDPICKGWPAGTRCLKAATVADHIVPWRSGGAKYDIENGAGMCSVCHGRKSQAEREAMHEYPGWSSGG